MPATLVVATHNSHKTGEIRAMVGDLFEEILDQTSFPGAVPPEENGSTFAENSLIKALAASRALSADFSDSLVLADDSGLEVDALRGAPGIHSARYAGTDADDAANREKLLAELAAPALRDAPRTARFRCVVTVARRCEVLAVFDGTVEGSVAPAMSGEGGFGYDPLFRPAGYDLSFAQLPAEVKNKLSHRGRALAKFREWWEQERG